MYLSRYNKCIMIGKCIETGDTFVRNDEKYPCFHAAFDFTNRQPFNHYNIHYKLFICKKFDTVFNNFAILDKASMKRFLSCVKLLIPFKYKFTEDKKYFYLTMDLEGTMLQHKGLLMLSRTLFEYPHNMCLADALFIKDSGVLGDINVKSYNLFDLYIICLASNCFSRDESFIRQSNYTLLPFDEIRKKLANKRRKGISYVIPYTKKYKTEFIKENWGGLKEMFSPDSIKYRLEVYARNLKSNLNA